MAPSSPTPRREGCWDQPAAPEFKDRWLPKEKMGTNLANNPLQIHHPVPQQAGPKASVKSDWSHVSSLFDFEFSSWDEIPGVDCPDVDTPRPCGVDGHDLTVQPNQISMTASLRIRNEKEEIAKSSYLEDLKVGVTVEKDCRQADKIEPVHTKENASYSAQENSKTCGLSCPFFKLDSAKHSSCRNHRFPKVKDVKRHLRKKHTKPCIAYFRSEKVLARQVKQKNSGCGDAGGGGPPECISEQQQQALRRKSRRGKSQRSQWYVIWDTIFPGLRRPDSPYLKSELEETVAEFRKFWSEEGTALVAEAVPSVPSHGSLGRKHQGVFDSLVHATLDRFERKMMIDANKDDSAGRQRFLVSSEQLDGPSPVRSQPESLIARPRSAASEKTAIRDNSWTDAESATLSPATEFSAFATTASSLTIWEPSEPEGHDLPTADLPNWIWQNDPDEHDGPCPTARQNSAAGTESSTASTDHDSEFYELLSSQNMELDLRGIAGLSFISLPQCQSPSDMDMG